MPMTLSWDEMNELLNRAGMDTISAGHAVAFALECYEAGIIGREDTGGLELTWGNSEAIVALVEQMVRREGVGSSLLVLPSDWRCCARGALLSGCGHEDLPDSRRTYARSVHGVRDRHEVGD